MKRVDANEDQPRTSAVGTVGVVPADAVVAGRYRIEATLGHGGMGEVLLAFDQHLRRQVALKKPRSAGPPDERALDRYGREARAAAALSHPNVVAVHDIVVEAGTPYIVMELVHGDSLSDVLAQGRPLDVDRALAIGEAVASALAYAHAAGLVHRDVKPGNVMLTAGGGVKVLDFGIARYLAATTPVDTRGPLGTPEYLSPEQIRGQAVDGRSDVYALGCVLYEMLTGRPPFAGDAVAVVYRHLEEVPVRPSVLNPFVPVALDAVVLRCLAKDPRGRYRRAGDLEDELRRIRHANASSAGQAVRSGLAADGTGVSAGADAGAAFTRPIGGSPTSVLAFTALPPRSSRSRPRRRLRRTLTAVLTLMLVAIAVAGTVAWRQVRGHASTLTPTLHPVSTVLYPPREVRAQGACDGFLRFRAVLSWSPTTSIAAQGYVIYRDDGSGGQLRLLTHIRGRSTRGFVDRNLGAATTYRYVVRAVLGSQLGMASPVAIAATPLLCMS